MGLKTTQEKTVDAIRILSAEAITAANSGHPGICLGAAPVGYALYADALNYSSANPMWDNRDRFILSAGHGSAFLYALLHLFGFGISKEDMAAFRKLGSKTPGHPEYGVTRGVEVSTGPLGQGIANAVGMAVAEAHLAAVFNREGFPVVDHYTYVLCGEGCLEEGISYEACSFAGTQKLGKLILIYDKNDITIDGDVSCTFNEDIAARFETQGWHVQTVEDSNDVAAVKAALRRAKEEREKPSLVICKSVIGYGAPNEGTAAVHGTPLTKEQLESLKEKFGWNGERFEVPAEVREHCRRITEEKLEAERKWNKLFAAYKAQYPDLAEKYGAYMSGTSFKPESLADLNFSDRAEATRSCGGKVLNKIAELMPNLLSGSADLASSTKTELKKYGIFSPENRAGRNIRFGIREHAMAAICNGIQVHGGLRAVCSTFAAFADYMKGAMRMSALMGLPVIYVLTHDSIGVGEDGPTHQPVEQLAALRATPRFNVFRPCNGAETAAAYAAALTSKTPSAIVLSRQALPAVKSCGNEDRGGYVLSDCGGKPDVILIASGSEVPLCVRAKEELERENISARVVSMPCMEIFGSQPQEYRDEVLPKDIKSRVCVEAASSQCWYRYGGDRGIYICLDTFGLSGSAEDLFGRFGFTVGNIVCGAKRAVRGDTL